MNPPVYLDHAATTPLDGAVLAVMQPYLTDQFYNPSATYLAARAVRKDVEQARADVAKWFGSRPSEVVFTAGGTEADNLAIQGVMQQYPHGNIIVSSVEHAAVLEPASRFDCRIVPVKADGVIDLVALERMIDDDTVVVSVMYVNNELGTVQPLRKIAEIVARNRKNRQERAAKAQPPVNEASKHLVSRPLFFHTDACQAPNFLDLHVSRLGVDMMTINASKIYGPKQVGALYVKTGTNLVPLIRGGGQEFGLRSGTENVAGVIGLAAALDKAQALRVSELRRLAQIQHVTLELITTKLPDAVVNGSQKQRSPNNIHITLPGRDNERLMMELDARGFQVAVGSACSASNEEPSHVLKAIGLTDAQAQSSLRITMGRTTTQDHMRQFVSELANLVDKSSNS